ncbi:MAG: iron-sulfur cluster assembly accessory protein [Sinobacteraceae bacterium]|nr:iron-sulfur cluster assembly accessory protein [Nevskiaceae bacterium]
MNLQLTESAAQRVDTQLKQRGHGIGLKLGVKRSGCSGYAYVLDYAEAIADDEQVIESHGVKVVVRQADTSLLEGLVVDFQREGLNEIFSFSNPNATAQCGCGESFAV